MDLLGLGVVIGAVLVFGALALLLLARSAVPVGADQALLINELSRIRVAFGPTFVLPMLGRAELVDLGVKTLTLSRRGREALSCRDGVRVEVDCDLTIALGRDVESILRAASTLGAASTFELEALRAAFANRLLEALSAVVAQLDIEQVQRQREDLGDRVLEVIGQDLGGYVVQDLVLARIEQAPRDVHDPANIRDARGIRKIVEETVVEAARVTELERELRVRNAQLRTEAEIAVAELLAHRSDVFGSLQRATGKRVDMDAVDREIDERLRALTNLEAGPPAS